MPVIGLAADDHLVVTVGPDVAEVLHAEVVLVGEEVGQPVVVHRPAKHVLRRDHALPDGVVPVLNAQMTTEQWVVGVRHVAGCVDVRLRGAQLCIDHDAVVCLQAGGHGQGGLRQHTDPDHNQVGLERRPVCQADDGGACVALDGGDPCAAPQVDAVCPVRGREDAGDLGPEDADERKVEGFQDGHMGAAGPCRRGNLQTDPSTAHDHKSAAEAQ